MIDAYRVNFLLGMQTIKEQRLMIDHSEDTLIFRDKRVELEENEKGHSMVKLELVKKQEEKDVKDLVEKSR